MKKFKHLSNVFISFDRFIIFLNYERVMFFLLKKCEQFLAKCEHFWLSWVEKGIRQNTWDSKIVPLRILVKIETYIVISYFCVPYGKSREVL